MLNTNECTAARLMVKYQCTDQSNETPNKPAIQSNNYQPSTPAPSYQNVPTTQAPTVQPVVEQAVPTYQQPQSGQSGTDLRYCLNLIDNKAIVECVRKAKK